MKFNSNKAMIILVLALILAVCLTAYMGTINPIIAGLGILAIIVIALNIYLEKFKK